MRISRWVTDAKIPREWQLICLCLMQRLLASIPEFLLKVHMFRWDWGPTQYCTQQRQHSQLFEHFPYSELSRSWLEQVEQETLAYWQIGDNKHGCLGMFRSIVLQGPFQLRASSQSALWVWPMHSNNTTAWHQRLQQLYCLCVSTVGIRPVLPFALFGQLLHKSSTTCWEMRLFQSWIWISICIHYLSLYNQIIFLHDVTFHVIQLDSIFVSKIKLPPHQHTKPLVGCIQGIQ